MSATCRPAEPVARFLVGPTRTCRVVEAPLPSGTPPMEIEVEALLEAGEAAHRGLTYRRLIRRLRQVMKVNRTTVIFANTRPLTEKITHDLRHDPKQRDACADGELGEIWVQGPSVASGYYDQPEATRQAFAARLAPSGDGPFLRTGDFGFLRSGQLFVTGRLKDLIIIRGRNFYPEDIELSVECAYEGLRAGHCAAFSIEKQDRECLVIVQEIEPRHRHLDAERALRAIRYTVAARHELEVYAIVLVKAGTIPKTSSGKTRRSECRRHYMDGQLTILAEWTAEPRDAEEGDAGRRPAPRGDAPDAAEVEAWLVQRIASRMRLPREQIDVNSPFLEFGMGSLDAVEIAADLEHWLSRPLSPTAIYNYPTISALACWLAGAGKELVPVLDCSAPAWSAAEVDPRTFDDEVRRMSEDQMEAFITKEMAKLRSETAHRELP